MAPRNPRRAANGKVCGNTSPYPKANLPRGGPLPPAQKQAGP
jgi:hypothetical protein